MIGRARLMRSFPWWGFVILALAGVVMVGVSLFSLRTYRSSTDATVDAARAVLQEAVVFLHLYQVQSEKRGYLATGDPDFKGGFEAARATVSAELARLDERDDWTPEQRAALDHVLATAASLQGYFQNSVDLMDAGRVEEARASANFERDSRLMAEIEEGLGVIARVEAAQQADAESRADQRALISAGAIVALALVTTALAAWVLISLHRRGEVQALRKANEAKDEVLAMLAHELRTPIAVIAGNANILRTRFENLDPADRLTSVAEVQREARRIEHMVAQMMALSSEAAAPPELEPTLVRGVITKAIERQLALHPGARVVVDIEEPVHVVNANAELAEHVIDNLLSNAMKYGPPEIPIEVRARNRGEWVEISVVDGGGGISADYRQRIFEPYVRIPGKNGHQDGMGLGLAVCKRLMQAQGGDIWLDDSDCEQTCFTVRLAAVRELAEV